MGTKKIKLSSLSKRFLLFSYLALLGAWGIIVPRLNILANQKIKPELQNIWFFIDVFSLTLSILSIFAMFYYYRKLSIRSKRVESLGEHNW